MVQQLPIVKIEGRHYLKDDRLQEYREVAKPQNKIAFEEIGERTVENVSATKTVTAKIKKRLQ